MQRPTTLMGFLALAILVGCGENAPAGPDLILTGGTIYVDPRGAEIASAIAIQGDVIVAVGDDEAIRGVATDDTQEMPLNGSAVTVGLHDGWVDIAAMSAMRTRVDLTRAASVREVLAVLRAELGTGTGPLVGWGWDERRWPDTRLPDTAALDSLTTDRPIVLYRRDGHVAWLNQAATAWAGVAGQHLMAGDEPTGLVVGDALGKVDDVLGQTAPLDGEHLLEALRSIASAGFTSVSTAPLDQRTAELLAELDPADVPIRVLARILPGVDVPADTSAVIFEAIGWVADGPLPLGLGGLAEPMADGRAGDYDVVSLSDACGGAIDAELPLDVQARGDAAIVAALECTATRYVVGADVLPVDPAAYDGARFIAMPGRLAHDLYWLDELLGPERAARAHAYRQMARQGVLHGIATGRPANDGRGFESLRIMLTRRDRQGYPLDSWQGVERLAVGDSLAAMLAGSPLRDRFEEGRPADLVVWSEDPHAGETALRDGQAMLTLVRGRVVYSRPLVTPPLDRRQNP